MGLNNSKLKELDISFEKKGLREYLVLTCGISEDIKEYQIEMINYNNHPGILKIEKCLRDNNIALLYDVTSKVTLSEYLQTYEYNKTTILSIFDYITSVCSDCSSYFLWPSGLLLHEDYIFTDTQTGQIYMIYVPIPIEGKAIENVKEMRRRILNDTKLRINTLVPEDANFQADYRDLHFCQSKQYILDEGSVSDKALNKEFKLVSLLIKKRELFTYLVCQFLIALTIAWAAPYFELAVGNIMTYIGMIFIIGAVNIIIINKVFSDKVEDYDKQYNKRGKEELTYRE